jgi:hypothetical protein
MLAGIWGRWNVQLLEGWSGWQESPAVIILLHTIYLFGGTKKEKERVSERGRLAAAAAAAGAGAAVAGGLGGDERDSTESCFSSSRAGQHRQAEDGGSQTGN